MLDWPKSEIQLINNDNYVDNKPASITKKPKQLNLNQNQKNMLHMLEGLVENLNQMQNLHHYQSMI